MEETKSEDACNAIHFRNVCDLLNKMEKESTTVKKLDLIFAKQLKTQIGTGSLYPLLRLLLSSIDTERGRYGLKEMAVAKTYISVLQLDKNSPDAQTLIHWKDPTKSGSSNRFATNMSSDFCTILENILKSRVKDSPSNLTLGEINRLLDDLAVAKGEDGKSNIIRSKILNNLCVNEQKWLMRIIFQDLKIGLKYEQILGRFYPSALQRYNECTNLRIVCEEEGTIKQLQVSGLQIFNHFNPMLAKGFVTSSNGQMAAVEVAMSKQPFVMDLKLDGERILCHIKGDDVTFFTRNGSDYTHTYQPLADMIKSRVNSRYCILDGEVLAWDNENKTFATFGKNRTVGLEEREAYEALGSDIKSNYKDSLTSWMTYVAFDIIYYEDPMKPQLLQQSLLQVNETLFSHGCEAINSSVLDSVMNIGDISPLPLILRRKILTSLVNPIESIVEIVQSKSVFVKDVFTRVEELQLYFNSIVEAQQEGLVVKNLLSPYVIGEKSRQLAYWVKAKPEYGDTEDLDLIVLGAYFGHSQNYRGEGLSRFLCGIKCDSNNSSSSSFSNIISQDEPVYRTLCKVGTGYSFDELKLIRKIFDDKGKKFDSKKPPDHLAHWTIGKTDDIPQVYINPQDSFVLQLKCGGIVDSTQFSAGLTCRFPRVQRFRFDKSINDILTLNELIEIKNQPRHVQPNNNNQNTHNSQQTLDEMMENMGSSNNGSFPMASYAKKRNKSKTDVNGPRKKRIINENKGTVDSNFRIRQDNVDLQGNIFHELIFCIMGGNSFSRDEVCLSLSSLIHLIFILGCSTNQKSRRCCCG